MCQHVIAARRLLAQHNPYDLFSSCGVVHHPLHPPAYLLVITPFVLPPSAIGAAVWDLVNLIGLAAVVFLVVREPRSS